MKYSQAEAIAISLNSMLQSKGIVGFKIARNLRMINEELKEYYDFKQELFKKYGEEADGSLRIQIGSPHYLNFMKEIEPLANQEIDLPFRTFTEEELEQSDLTGEQMLFLMNNFMQEGEDDGSNN